MATLATLPPASASVTRVTPYASLAPQLPALARSESDDARERAERDHNSASTSPVLAPSGTAETKERHEQISSALAWLAVQRQVVTNAGRRFSWLGA